MSCAEMRVLLHGMLDRQLDLADAVRVETHMQVCPDCTAEYRKQGALRAAIRRSEPRYRPPHDLRAGHHRNPVANRRVVPGSVVAASGHRLDGHGRVIGLGSKSVVCRRDAWRAGNSARTDLRTRSIVVGEPSHGCDDLGRAHGQAVVQR